jgi:hypothetical protein
VGSGAALPDKHTVAAGGTRIYEVVHDVVAEVAPEELPLVTGLDMLDDDAVVRRLGRQGGRREPLGFGLGEVATLVTPVVWLMIDEAARRVGGAAIEGAAKGSKAVLRRLLRRPAAPVTVPALTRQQLAEVHRRVLETAAQRGLGDRRATLIADAVVTRLALTAPGNDRPEPNRPDGDRTAPPS